MRRGERKREEEEEEEEEEEGDTEARFVLCEYATVDSTDGFLTCLDAVKCSKLVHYFAMPRLLLLTYSILFCLC